MTLHVSNNATGIETIETVSATRFVGWRPKHPSHHENAPSPTPTTVPEKSDRATGLDNASLRFLRAIVAKPGLPSSQYARLARLNAQRAVEVRRLLVERGFLREHAVATSLSGKGRGRGRSAIVLEPLDAAVELINEARGPS